ncbi:Rv1733c family protein [Streptomyces sp. NPDC001070]
MKNSVVFWRWRRNPLRRGTDVAEAWTGVAAAVLVAVGAPAAGAATAVAVEHDALHQGDGMRQVRAVVTEDAADAVENDYTGSTGKVRATVRWTAPDGAAHTGTARVDPNSRAGSTTRIWVDRHDDIREPPLTPVQAEVQGQVFGVLAAVGACGLVLAGRWAVRVRIDRHRAQAWDREWAEVGPSWGHRRA